MILLNSLAATYICFNVFLLLNMLRRIYMPTTKELETYTEEDRQMDRKGIFLFIPLTLTIGLFGFLISQFESEEK